LAGRLPKNFIAAQAPKAFARNGIHDPKLAAA
jgi:hypothetical protein